MGFYRKPKPTPFKAVTRCPGCSRKVVPEHAWRTGQRQDAETYSKLSDGTCAACRMRKIRAARVTVRRKTGVAVGSLRPKAEEIEGIIEDYDMIRDSVNHIRQAADRIGIGYTRLDKILYRARQKGDPRGRPPLEQFERAIDRGAPFGRQHGHRTQQEAA